MDTWEIVYNVALSRDLQITGISKQREIYRVDCQRFLTLFGMTNVHYSELP